MTDKILLHDNWQFYPDEAKVYTSPPEVFQEEMPLPGTTAQNQKGKRNQARETSFLTELYPYAGNAWFQYQIRIPETHSNQKLQLFLERTRVTKLWINGSYIGARNSLCTPHIYDISEFSDKKNLKITICVDNTDYPTKGGHMTSPDTQTNWNGITGEISLRFFDTNHIVHVKVITDIQHHEALLAMQIQGDFEWIQAEGEWLDINGKVADFPVQTIAVIHDENEKHHAFARIKLDENAPVWDEYTPVICKLRLHPADSRDVTEVSFGLTDFKAEGLQFKSHNRPVFLRGKHDGMIFPLTGAVPTTVEEWMKVLQISKSYGINHYRFHTCCPPEAAFTAADLLGMYFEPELPLWGTLQAPDEDGFNETEQNYLIQEGWNILNTFGNHPSFCLFSLGNELWGNPRRIGEIIAGYKKFEKRILFTQGSNNFQHFPNIQPEDDFFVGVRLDKERLIRGSYATCDIPQGHIQTERPSKMHSYDAYIRPEQTQNAETTSTEIEIQYGTGVKKVQVNSAFCGLIPDKPVITHEIGQYCMYPDFSEIEKYTGVLKARNFEIFRERLADAGMADLAEDFLYCSGMLAVQCYQEELEAALRSKYISGFQILDIQDFTGQGTALVGILNAFMENKGLVTPKKWRSYCSDSVLLGQFADYVLTDKLDIKISLRHHAPSPVTAPVHYLVKRGKITMQEGDIPVTIHGQGLFEIGNIHADLPPVSHMHKITVKLSLPHTENSYQLWQCPILAMPSLESTDKLCITSNLMEAKIMLKHGKQVLYFAEHLTNKIPGFYCSDFWCYPMFRSIAESMGKEIPVGTLGLNIHKHHQALGNFRCKRWSTPQWYDLVTHADCAILDHLPIQPIVQVIDNFERNHKLGLLFECNVDKGKLLVCTIRVSEIADRPETAQFTKSLIDYASSETFAPKVSLSISQIEQILR